MSIEKNYRGNGKLLLTGEYFVLDGAEALAVPTKLGQRLSVNIQEKCDNLIHWKSFDNENKSWFEATINTAKMSVLKSNNEEVSDRLLQMFDAIKTLNPKAFSIKNDLNVATYLEFPQDWGLGSSSTLIYTLAKWCEVNPYLLLEKTMGGSGYDIACAGENTAILYQRKENEATYQTVDFDPSFSENLYFIFLGRKQNSREGIARYRAHGKKNNSTIAEISELTKLALLSNTLSDFEKIIFAHEKIISSVVSLPCAKDLYFQDYFGTVKSLGAWGGDFVMATSDRSFSETQSYFQKKGFQTVLPYCQIILDKLVK